MQTNDIRRKLEEAKANGLAKRARDFAQELGISEAALLAAQVGHAVCVLEANMEAILTGVEKFGEVMALTRNESCVHERKGVYESPQFFNMGKMSTGLYFNPDIDLRLFLDHWKFAFAVSETIKTGTRNSLQFFDKEGQAIHKIYLTEQSNESEFASLVERFKAETQFDYIEVEAYEPKVADLVDGDVDWKGLRKSWENIKDIHEFFPMLKKYRVGREQAFSKIGTDFAYQVDLSSARKVLNLAKENECKIMVFVGNRGCIQIHTGEVNKLLEHGKWYNVLDPKFNLHLNEEQIGRIWVTRKPSNYGHITAVEVFDKSGEIIVTFFGQREQKEPEQELWRGIVSELTIGEVSHAA